MASCEYGETWLLDALDGVLADGELRAWDSHLASCAVCQADWLSLRSTASLFRNPRLVAPPPGFRQAVVVRVNAHVVWAKRRRGAAILAGSLFALAAIWLPLLITAALVYIGLSQQPTWMGPLLPILDQGVFLVTSLLGAGWVVIHAVVEALIDQPMALMWATILAALLGGWIYGFRQLRMAQESAQE